MQLNFKLIKLIKLPRSFQSILGYLKRKDKVSASIISKFDKFTSLDYKILANYCKKIKIDFLSTPFDLESVNIINPLVLIFKISSSDISNVPLLRKISSIGKPVLLSTGDQT